MSITSCFFVCLFVSYYVCVYEREVGLRINNAFGILFMVYFCPFKYIRIHLALRASKYPYRLEGQKYTINKMPQALCVHLNHRLLELKDYTQDPRGF